MVLACKTKLLLDLHLRKKKGIALVVFETYERIAALSMIYVLLILPVNLM